MKYKIEDDWFKKRLNSLTPYTSKEEKALLLLDDDASIFEMLDLISDVKPKNEYEALALFFKYCAISVSDLIEATQECPNCKFANPIQVEIDEFFNLEKKYDFPVGIFTTPDDIINTKRADKIILNDYNKLTADLIEQSKNVFKISVKRKCIKCSSQFDIIINPKTLISKSSASSIFREYIDISYFTANSILDIDTMFPYEREIYLNILKEKLKENQGLPGLKE